MKEFFSKVKSICRTIVTSIRVHFIRTKEYKKLIQHNQELEQKIHNIADESMKFFEHKTDAMMADLRKQRKRNDDLEEMVETLKSQNLELKEKYIAKVEEYYEFLTKIN